MAGESKTLAERIALYVFNLTLIISLLIKPEFISAELW